MSPSSLLSQDAIWVTTLEPCVLNIFVVAIFVVVVARLFILCHCSPHELSTLTSLLILPRASLFYKLLHSILSNIKCLVQRYFFRTSPLLIFIGPGFDSRLAIVQRAKNGKWRQRAKKGQRNRRSKKKSGKK